MTQGNRKLAPLIAICCGVLAAYGVVQQQRSVRAQVGPLERVVVAANGFERGDKLDAALAERGFAVRSVPRSMLPDGPLVDPMQLIGATLAAPLARGAIVTERDVASPSRAEGGLEKGERQLRVPATLAGAADAQAGDRVDVLATGEAGGGFAELLLAGAELIAVDQDDAGADAAQVTLRVTLRQAARLLAARAGGATLALLARAPGDRAVSSPLLERLRGPAG